MFSLRVFYVWNITLLINKMITYIIVFLLGLIGLILTSMSISGRSGTNIKGTNYNTVSNNWLAWTVISVTFIIIVWLFILSQSGVK